MAAGIIIARSLGPEGKGIYAVAFVLPALMVMSIGFESNTILFEPRTSSNQVEIYLPMTLKD